MCHPCSLVAGRAARGIGVLALIILALLGTACSPLITKVPLLPTITTQTVAFTVSPNTAASQTAVCPTGFSLVSGGYASSDQVPIYSGWEGSFVATNVANLQYTGRNAAGGQNSAYSVPSGCGNAQPAIDAATSAVGRQLASKLPSGQVAIGTPDVVANTASLTCSPAAGTSQANPFTYVQKIDVSATQMAFDPGAVRRYQSQRLQEAAATRGSDYGAEAINICVQGIQARQTSPIQATLTCPTSGFGVFEPSQATVQALERQVAGESVADAEAYLLSQPGFSGAKLTFYPADLTRLPSNASQPDVRVFMRQRLKRAGWPRQADCR